MSKFDIDTLVRDVSAKTWERMLIEISLGQRPKANNAKERAVRDRLTGQVAEIHRKGGVVDIPHDIPYGFLVHSVQGTNRNPLSPGKGFWW